MMQELKSVDSPSSTTDESPPQRPKRSTCQKNLGSNYGLSWREETDLKRALYASLQENKRRNADEEEEKELNNGESAGPNVNSREASPRRLGANKTKVHAQRKFAQGSTPNSPLPTPVKLNNVVNPRTEILPCRRPKTEDFLTFLCLRGSTILPPSMDFLNICSKSDTSSDSRCNSPDLESNYTPSIGDVSSNCKSDHRTRNNGRHEPVRTDLVKGNIPCKASASRQKTDSATKSNASQQNHTKLNKEALKKRKSTEEDSDYIPSKLNPIGAMKTSGGRQVANSRTRSSMVALREKYKQKRIASNHVKKTANNVCAKSSKKTSSPDHTEKMGVRTRNDAKNKKTDVVKNPRSHTEQKLALEKRQSLRSANIGFGRRRKMLLRSNTPWLRKAKLVPPVVDVDSESDPEVITICTSPKTRQKDTKSSLVTRQSHRTLSEKLRSSRKRIASTDKTNVPSRSLRLKRPQKISPLRNKTSVSKPITKLSSRLERIRKLKSGLVSQNRMSLRNDTQVSKPLTRSSARPLVELLPKRRGLSKQEVPQKVTRSTRRISVENKVLLRNRSNSLNKEQGNAKCEEKHSLQTRSQKELSCAKIEKRSSKNNVSLSRHGRRIIKRTFSTSSDDDKPLAKTIALKSTNTLRGKDNKTKKGHSAAKSLTIPSKKDHCSESNVGNKGNLDPSKRLGDSPVVKITNEIFAVKSKPILNVFRHGSQSSSLAKPIDLMPCNVSMTKVVVFDQKCREFSSQKSVTARNSTESSSTIGVGNGDMSGSSGVSSADVLVTEKTSFTADKSVGSTAFNDAASFASENSVSQSSVASCSDNMNHCDIMSSTTHIAMLPTSIGNPSDNSGTYPVIPLQARVKIEQEDIPQENACSNVCNIRPSESLKTEPTANFVTPCVPASLLDTIPNCISVPKNSPQQNALPFFTIPVPLSASLNPPANSFVEYLKEKLQQDFRNKESKAEKLLAEQSTGTSAALLIPESNTKELPEHSTVRSLPKETTAEQSQASKKSEKELHKSSKENDKKSHKSSKSSLKGKTKKKGDREHHKVKKEGEKEGSKSSKKEDKDSKSHKKESKLFNKALKRELEKELSKSHKKDSSKEKTKTEDASSSKSCKKDSDKESSKSSRKDSDRDSLFSEKVASSKSSSSESKRDKSSKKLSFKKKKKKVGKNFKKISKSILFGESDVLRKHSSLKELKRRSSSEKSEIKKLLSKSKKRKKLELLKAKKLSKKLSSKLLRKYAKKKGLKLKKNKLKLKKKVSKKEGLSLKSSSQGEKSHQKAKKQKHKNKSDRQKKESHEKGCGPVASNDLIPNIKQEYVEATPVNVSCVSTSTDTMDNANAVSVGCAPLTPENTLAAARTEVLHNSVSTETYTEVQEQVTTSLPSFDESHNPSPTLQTCKDNIAQVSLDIVPDVINPLPKVMADAATNTCEDDILESSEPFQDCTVLVKSEEMSVGTQTMTPMGSPVPLTELKIPQSVTSTPVDSPSIVQNCSLPNKSIQKSKSVAGDCVSSIGSQANQPTKRRKSFSSMASKKSRISIIKDGIKKPWSEKQPHMMDAPVFTPSLAEFQDPLEYIAKIQPAAQRYGICKIIPPASFKPDCKVNDDMRFTAHNQYIHKMLSRWGPNVQQLASFQKHLKSQKVQFVHAPLIGGIELDLVKFYHTVQHFGGLQQVIEKKKWQRVADSMHIPKAAQDRVTKLYDAYCKYLVSYETLPPDEKKKLDDEVVSEHGKLLKMRLNSKDLDNKEDSDEADEEENNDCVTKGRSMTLSNFFRVARNTMSMWYKNETNAEEVEHEFWKIVTDRLNHVVVHAGNIDSSVYQSGFPSNRSSPFAKHPWNLKVLTNNSNSILRCMGPVSGVTIPTLHVAMLFTAGCWYRDPHSLPWIEYLHTGASKIWYSIPPECNDKFRNAMGKIMPEYCGSNPVWLASDTAMVPPDVLVKNGTSLCRTIQHSGQFIVIFPESFTSTICCGYSISESVYFAPPSWLDVAEKAFQDIKDSCEPPAFSLEKLLFCISTDGRTQPETLEKILPMIEKIRDEELCLRKQLSEAGLANSERLPLLEKKKKSRGVDEYEQECDICRRHCYVSMVSYPQEDSIYCLHHALQHIPKEDLKMCKLMFMYDESELQDIVKHAVELVSEAQNLQKSSIRKKSPKKRFIPTATKPQVSDVATTEH